MIDADQLHELICDEGVTVAVAESLTGGAVTARLVAVPGSGEWLRGGVVAYDAEVKFSVLGVERGCVVTKSCAEQMALGVVRTLDAEVAVSTTGVAGPESLEGREVGTVLVAVADRGRCTVEEHHFDGSPHEVREQAVNAALEALASTLRRRSAHR
ncbi:MAG: nicotinamide-nucleotide amidase [Acidimicrobiia bacterium]|nr:nicotinamide-nucleotide amidase [Acidimicrobiia bacterium]